MSDFSIGKKHYQYVPAPHLNEDSDWHDAYIEKIHKMLNGCGSQSNPIPVPAYPLINYRDQHSAVFEFGSYWEGAIYYLNKVLDATSTSLQLAVVKRCINKEYTSDNEILFSRIWDSQNQLSFLKAFLIREYYQQHEECKYTWEWGKNASLIPSGISEDLEWLRTFIRNFEYKGARYPNPFFGGQNPLHLGLISLEK